MFENCNVVKENRVGRFRIRASSLRDLSREVREFLAKVVIVRAEMLFVEDAMEYVGYSELFEVCPPHTSGPDYQVSFQEGAFTLGRAK